MKQAKALTKNLTKAELEARSRFRTQLRSFEQVGEQAARDNGVTLSQYLLLLHIGGMPGREWALVGELAQRLGLAHHSAVGLVSRSEAAGLVRRERGTEDKREVQVRLTPRGQRILQAVAQSLDDEFGALLACLQG